MALRFPRFCRLAEFGAQAIRRRQVGLYFATYRADGCAVSELGQRRAVRLTLLDLGLRRWNAQWLFQREWRRLGTDQLLAFRCGHAYRYRVQLLRGRVRPHLDHANRLLCALCRLS